MSMEVTAWVSLYNTMNAQQDKRPFSKATLKRILVFARPHRVRLTWFLVLSVVLAVLAVATPVLAGRVVNAIGRPRPCLRRHLAGRHHRGDRGPGGRARHRRALALGLDRRRIDPRPPADRLRPRPADADRILHADPHRRAGQSAQQRRDRRTASVQRHAVRCREQHRLAGAHVRRHDRDLVADHAAWRWFCCRSS